MPPAWHQRGLLYNWRAKYSGLEASDLLRLKHVEDENRQLKEIVADQALNAGNPLVDMHDANEARVRLNQGRGG